MKSTGSIVRVRAAGPILLTMVLLGPQAVDLSAQGGARIGLRAGGGVVSAGHAVYGGQIEVVDSDASGSVELALTGWGGVRTVSQQDVRTAGTVHQSRDEMRIWGFGVLASYLWGHSRRTAWPYLALGIGLGPLWADWRADSTDLFFGTPAPEGGSFRVEEGVRLGTLLNVGIGQRLHDRLDVRAQMLTLLVPSTDLREDAKLVPLFTLTSGFGL